MADDDYNPRSLGSVFGVLVGWIVSAAIVAGPWVAMVVYVPEVQPWMHATYWMSMGTYLLAAVTFSPMPDTTELGWLGGMMDNPFSFEDDFNRNLLMWALILWPGKLVWLTLMKTWSLIRG